MMLENASTRTERVKVETTVRPNGNQVSKIPAKFAKNENVTYTPPSACCMGWIKLWYAASRAAYRSVPLSLMLADVIVSAPA